MSAPAVAKAGAAPSAGTSDHQLENLLFPTWRGPARAAALFVYYLAILLGLLLIYGRGDFATAPFVYQGF